MARASRSVARDASPIMVWAYAMRILSHKYRCVNQGSGKSMSDKPKV